ncbi:ribosome maturation factor RimP [soil metagenome]
MSTTDRVRQIVEPLLAGDDGFDQVELVDIEHAGAIVRVSVDRQGGVDLDVLARLTRQLSRALDDADPVAGRYTLEVTSPGLERPLRTPAHFQRAVGADVKIKTTAGIDGQRRFRGVISAADDHAVTLRLAEGQTGEGGGPDVRLPFDQIDRARTVFEWGPAPKPTPKRKKRAAAP